jgi:hypothetical protein
MQAEGSRKGAENGWETISLALADGDGTQGV